MKFINIFVAYFIKILLLIFGANFHGKCC